MTNVVKHFELAYETGWKFLKQYLHVMHNIDVASPKGIFQACLKQEILPESITNQLALLADTRNLTTHMYDIVIAQEVNSEIDQHYAVLGQILKLVKLPEAN
jgi:nucleotidyltransferase substrate binding protein (TIGR01987 family)